MERWKDYIQELFEDGRQQEVEIEKINREDSLAIAREEIMYSMKLVKNNKAPGPDEIAAEIIKLIEQDQERVGLHVDCLLYTSRCV